MNIWLVSAVFLFFIGSASSQLTPWDNQLFKFDLTPGNSAIAACSNITIGWSDIPTQNPASTPPYHITVLCSGYQPISIATEQSQSYIWTVGLPTGGPYIMFMEDANGFSGSGSFAFNVSNAAMGVTCPASPYVSSSLSLTSTGTIAECSQFVVTATGGTAPYTMEIFGVSRPPKTTTWTTPQMSYTIDMKPGGQFYVLVTDANGLSGADGMHYVTTGDNTECLNLATTVSAGAIPSTTLSYDPSSTFSFPSGGVPSSSTNVIQNTATTTLVTTVTAADGSLSAITLAPGTSTTIVAGPNTPTNGTSSPISAIVGGAVGGTVLLFFLILFLWWRRRAARAKQVGMHEIHDPHSMPIGTSPYTPAPPGRDTAALVGRMSSTNSTGSGHTPAPSTPGMSFFGGNNNLTTPGHEETQPWGDHNNLATGPEETPAWAIPVTSPTDSNTYSSYRGGSPPLMESSSMPVRSASASSRPNGLPPGAMIPRANAGGMMPEKATFVPASPWIVAPPSYTHGG